MTALVGESYSRAYHLMVSVQLLSELEEIIQCLIRPERKAQLQQTWWKRLQVRYDKDEGEEQEGGVIVVNVVPPPPPPT